MIIVPCMFALVGVLGATWDGFPWPLKALFLLCALVNYHVFAHLLSENPE